MTPAERMAERSIDRFPWESSVGGASVRQEDAISEQVGFEAGTFFDCKLGSMLRTACVTRHNLDAILPILYSGPDVMTDLQQVSDYGFRGRNEQERAMARLEDVANAKDERAFLEALKGIEWQNRPPADFVRAAQLALKAGAYAVAHQISVEGTKHYPDDPGIRKYARVWAPPETRIGKAISDSKHWANREWLKDHGGEYSGQWVAVRDGKLLGAAGSPKELARQVGDIKDVLLTKVL